MYLKLKSVNRQFFISCIIRTHCSLIPQKLESAMASKSKNILNLPYFNSVMRFLLEEVNKLLNLLTAVSRTELFCCNTGVTKNYEPNLKRQLHQSPRSWLRTKVYYAPLYFGIYFTIYIGYLILKAISMHKIQIPATAASSSLLFARNYQSSPFNLLYIPLIFD